MSTHVIEVESGAFNELRNALRRVSDRQNLVFERELPDGRAYLDMGTVLVTTPILYCPDCANGLQHTGVTLKFLKHKT